jgi:orotidine-5'-phosphate decarboxylase
VPHSAKPQSGKDALIVALDLPTAKAALKMVEVLDNVSFFKLGLQLFVAGELRELLKALREKRLFVDLKVPGDIGNTIASVVDLCIAMGVKFLTLSESMPLLAISSAKSARDAKHSVYPKFLTVPFLSSLDRSDLREMNGTDDLNDFILRRARTALHAGCDGMIASGQEISLCRTAFSEAIIVSPGIRPIGVSANDHKRFTTPTEAINLGADYLVVGRPILQDKDPRKAADKIIAEIDAAIGHRKANNPPSPSPKKYEMSSLSI